MTNLPRPLLLALALTGASRADVLINEFMAAGSDRLLVREAGQYPRVGNTTPWQSPAYDDAPWKTGAAPFGFGTFGGVAFGTNVSVDMQNRTGGLFLRKSFAASAGTAGTLQLAVRYNDGFIAFLNGVEIARRNMGAPGMFAYRDQTAFNAGAGTATETIDLGSAASLLLPGQNVLCIQVHNKSLLGADGANLLLSAGLTTSAGATLVAANASWKYFTGVAEPSGGLIDYGLLAKQAAANALVAWASPAFNDTSWVPGAGPVGTERANPPSYVLGTNLQAETFGITPSVYIRNTFTATAAEVASSFPLSMTLDYDDGIVVYINGKEAVRRNLGTAGVPASHTLLATVSHPATNDDNDGINREEIVALGQAKSLLVAGDNVVAIQIHQNNLASTDLLAKLTLRTTGSAPRTLVSPADPVRYFIGTQEPLVENEENDSGDVADDGVDSEIDWIELRNTAAQAVALDGWSLSDDAAAPRKWNFPAGSAIPPNGYLTVAATGLDLTPAADGTTYLHTNFKLSAAGEPLVLTRADGAVADQLAGSYPRQVPRYSYGRDVGGTFGYLATATPGRANIGTVLLPAPALPTVSRAGGFVTGSASISLATATTGASVRYTTDGSDPLGGGTIYTSPVPVTANTVLRARSVRGDSIPSEIVTHTYLLNQLDARKSLAAICIGADPALTLYGPNTTGGPAAGEGIFSIKGGIYNGEIWSPGTDTSAFQYPLLSGRSSEKPASLEYLPLSGNPLRTEFGLRISGSPFSRPRYRLTDPAGARFTPALATQKPSFNFFFRSEFGDRPLDYPFFAGTVTRFSDIRARAGKNDITNPFIKDEMLRRIFIKTGQQGSLGTFNTLWINGVYKGFYNLTEHLRESFMQEHHQSTATWDVQQVNEFSSGDPLNWNRMIAFLRATDLSDTANYEKLKDFLDIDNFIDYLLVNSFAGMWDWPNNNWVAARERSSLGRWRFYMWDAEGAFGGGGRDTSYNTFISDLIITDAGMTTDRYIPAIYTLLRNAPEFRLRFADRAQKQLFNDGALTTAQMTPIYVQLRNDINPILQNTTGQTVDSGFYDTWVAASPRRDIYFSQLTAQNLWPSLLAPTLNQYGGTIASGFVVSAGNPNAQGSVYLTTDGSDPRLPGGATSVAPYGGAFQLSGTTRVRARVLAGTTWSPEVDYTFTLPFAQPTFLPAASADWTANANWSGSPAPYPDGVDKVAAIPGAATADRNVNLKAPVTIGRLIFDQAATAFRNRVRDQNTGNTLTFSGIAQPAEIRVNGTGPGYVEFENLAGTVLANQLALNVTSVTGNPDYGALRLRAGWTGTGGLTKTGPGIASLTGEGKAYSGPTLIQQGVLQVTQPAVPAASTLVKVSPGGQLRLTSSSDGGPPLLHAFGGPLQLAGYGRGAEISDNEQQGKLGALRLAPGGGVNRSVIANPVLLTAPAGIHVDGGTNTLELSASLGGNFPLYKSGGGTLVLAGDESAYTGHVELDIGKLEIHGPLGSSVEMSPAGTLTGYGQTGAISGEGNAILLQTRLRSPSGTVSRYSLVFGRPGDPDFADPAAAGNAVHLLETPPAGLLAANIYLAGPPPVTGQIYRGGLAVPYGQNLAAAIAGATIRVFTADPAGSQNFNGAKWSPVPLWSVATVASAQPFAAPFANVRTLELTIGGGNPSAFALWQAANFPAPGDLADPLVSGPLANPSADGTSNLLHYALGIPAASPAAGYLPTGVETPFGRGLRFPFDSRRADVAIVVESSEDAGDWSAAVVLFDSRVDFPPAADSEGRITVDDVRPAAATRFYRLRVTLE